MLSWYNYFCRFKRNHACLQCSDEDFESMSAGTFVEQMLIKIEKALPEDLRPHFLKQKWWFFYHPFLMALAAVDVVLVWFE